jgi:hypothetical protein
MYYIDYYYIIYIILNSYLNIILTTFNILFHSLVKLLLSYYWIFHCNNLYFYHLQRCSLLSVDIGPPAPFFHCSLFTVHFFNYQLSILNSQLL